MTVVVCATTVPGLVGALGVVFAAFAEDMGADVQGIGLLLCLVG
jgi:tRNA A37 threonylcarbamoyltransferase TsaD